MKKILLAVVSCVLAVGWLPALVVRPAPNVQWLDVQGRRQNLSAFKGQPVVLLISDTPNGRGFRSQAAQLKKMFERFAAQRVVCVAAFTGELGVIHSNIPFAIASDGPRVAFDYGTAEERFAIAVIGRDGNLDCLSTRVLPAQRIYDIIGNSFVTQQQLRRP